MRTPIRPPDLDVLAVTCPHCGATPGEPCSRRKPHLRRRRAALIAEGSWPPRCDCCGAALCSASTSSVVLSVRGDGAYCGECATAIDQWTGAFELGRTSHGLPVRCLRHLPPGRAREVIDDYAASLDAEMGRAS